MSCGAPDVRVRAYVTGTTVTVSIAATGEATAVTVGCAQHPQRTHRAGQLPSGTVSVTDVHVSGETKAIRPEASARRIANTTQRRTRDKPFLYSTIRIGHAFAAVALTVDAAVQLYDFRLRPVLAGSKSFKYECARTGGTRRVLPELVRGWPGTGLRRPR